MTEKYSEAKVLAILKLLEHPQSRRIQDAIRDWLEAKHPQDSRILSFKEDIKCREWFKKRSSLLRPGYIYVIEAVSGDGIYKVGRSKNPDRRLTQLPTKAPYELKIESTYPTDAMVWAESLTHDALSMKKMGSTGLRCCEIGDDGYDTGEFVAERINGEWFQGWFYKYKQIDEWPDEIDKAFCTKNYGSVPLMVDLMFDVLHRFSLKKCIGESIGWFLANEIEGFWMPPGNEDIEDYWYWAEFVELIDGVDSEADLALKRKQYKAA